MILLSNVYKFILDYFEADVIVNTISTVKYDEIGSFKQTIYPLVNVELLPYPTELESNVLFFKFGITSVAERDFDKTVKNTKIIGKDNKIDNLNAMNYVLQRFITKTLKQNNPFNISISEVSDTTNIENDFTSGLDGFTCEITFSIPNTIPIC